MRKKWVRVSKSKFHPLLRNQYLAEVNEFVCREEERWRKSENGEFEREENGGERKKEMESEVELDERDIRRNLDSNERV